ncbi:hypothetical protein [Geobacter sp.]|uniref:hypothetical protein n=1 Tax=Geobacter sp. TaxID=46610 RepID=UPI001AD4A5C3|nr:hypothetical protein [Geobacter sp.]CAG0994085.1 hypothetical protein ANRL4_02652 [Anaerolineae bacterium]
MEAEVRKKLGQLLTLIESQLELNTELFRRIEQLEQRVKGLEGDHDRTEPDIAA